MFTSGFTNAPVSKALVFASVLLPFVASVTDTKHFLYVQVVPHLWVYRQFWRLFTWQICYVNSAEVLFAVMTFYQLRVVERLWGPRKYASFLISTLPYTSLLPPLVLALVLRPLSLNHVNYLPAGPTAVLFAALAQYHAAIPYIYKYRLAATAPAPTPTPAPPSAPRSARSSPSPSFLHTPVTLTSKTLSYVPAAQVALAQLPGSALAALVGWAVGTAYRNEVLPGRATAWRVPGWVLGERKRPGGLGRGGRERFEGLRRRLEDEGGGGGGGGGGGAGRASGVQGQRGQAQGEARRRTLGEVIAEQFRGAR
ncbi:hypothetical protein BDY21DRAFT_315978 [Lineolata rhizophorae]|uniref:Peptidase S54 rhomboid domain-containing protein n=1 Tax=Lineolata rhizophorae TaxID=578093 RepID=A0A6A6P9N5_9PEZI|nr:hypothetical protein BDY21DRAFT_315978 [Lineolata rhizophorae]